MIGDGDPSKQANGLMPVTYPLAVAPNSGRSKPGLTDDDVGLRLASGGYDTGPNPHTEVTRMRKRRRSTMRRGGWLTGVT